MATTNDIKTTKISGLNHIDALLDIGPDWNYLTSTGNNTIYYTFSIASGNEVINGEAVTGQQAFSASQQYYTRSAMTYIAQLTGINFVETAAGDAAQVHFANMNVASFDTAGVCSWNSTYRAYATGELISYDADAYVYLDNVEHAGVNADLAPGELGYEYLLHELGHMLGLKHPHEGDIVLTVGEDSTANTMMSYKHDHDAGHYTGFNGFDVAALAWIYGGDGLGGTYGFNSAGGRFLIGSMHAETLQGTSSNDKLRGEGGNDMIYGSEGIDTAIFGGTRASYTFNELGNGQLAVSGIDGIDTLDSIEVLEFSDGTVTRSQVVDSTPPAQPQVSVVMNANGYVSGNTPTVKGSAEANSTIRIFNGTSQVGSGQADANGLFTIPVSALADGSYVLSATATDAAGNASAASSLSFKVDATAPVLPTGGFVLSGGDGATGNQPFFGGTAEPGSIIGLVTSANEWLGVTRTNADGNWSMLSNPIPNANYSVQVRSYDAAGNLSVSTDAMNFAIASNMNLVGGPGNDTLTGNAGNNALVGMSGLDTAIYAGPRANYTVTQSTNGFTIGSAADGFDSLLGVERIRFGDAMMALDIEGTGGKAYRIYAAAFARTPDVEGLGFWIDNMDDGSTLHYVAQEFMNSAEFAARYGTNLSTEQFISMLYRNVLHRELDQAGYDFWVNSIEVHGASRVEVLVNFSESAENKDQVIDTIGNGFVYVPWTGA